MTQSLSAARPDAGVPAKLVADWMMSELARHFTAGLSFDESAVDAPAFADLLRRIQDGTISPSSAREVLDDLWQLENKTPGAVDAIAEHHNRGVQLSYIDATLGEMVASIRIQASPGSSIDRSRTSSAR